MAQTPLTSTKTVGDVVKNEYDQRFNRVVGNFDNDSGADITIDDAAGYPVQLDVANDITLIVAGQEANANGLLLYEGKLTIPDTENKDLVVLRRGPAMFNKDALPDDDHADAALDKDAIATALLDENIVELTEPTKQTEQTT